MDKRISSVPTTGVDPTQERWSQDEWFFVVYFTAFEQSSKCNLLNENLYCISVGNKMPFRLSIPSTDDSLCRE